MVYPIVIGLNESCTHILRLRQRHIGTLLLSYKPIAMLVFPSCPPTRPQLRFSQLSAMFNKIYAAGGTAVYTP